MNLQRIGSRGAISIALILTVAQPAEAEMDGGKALLKFTRGFVNIVTGWVEIPKRIYETSQTAGTAAGFTWGTLRGIGYGFVRTVAGLYEFLTFPFPAPPNYEPVIEPEYVFIEEEKPLSTQEYKYR